MRWQGATPTSLKVERRFAGEGLGWCLVATADIEPEEVRSAVVGAPLQLVGTCLALSLIGMSGHVQPCCCWQPLYSHPVCGSMLPNAA